MQAEVYFKNLVGVQEREKGEMVGVSSVRNGGRNRGGSGGRNTPGGVRLVGKEDEWGGEGFPAVGERMRSSGEGGRARAGSGD